MTGIRVISSPLPPGSTIGILGGGQLGRMTAMAAAEFGMRSIVFAPDADCIAGDMATVRFDSPYDDHAKLLEFAGLADVVTIEFENVPAQTLAYLSQHVPVAPGAAILEVTQDRLAEKQFLQSRGIGVAPFARIDNAQDIGEALAGLDGTGILKTRLMGYDGKGQVRLNSHSSHEAAMAEIAGQSAILEGFVAFESEISVIAARGWDGGMRCFPPVENRHKDGILDVTIAPADIAPDIAKRAIEIAEEIARGLNLVGLIAVEMFLLPGGEILVNEMAPRPHNSGHWTMDGCAVSQFEQLLRAIGGWPFGDSGSFQPTRMRNLIGADVKQWHDLAQDGEARLHIYGKKEVRAGRKMGHVNWVDTRT